MKRAAALLFLAALAMVPAGCREPPPEVHNYRFEFAGTQGLKVRGYWITYGVRNAMPTTEELMVTVPDTIFATGVGLKFFSARKLPGEGTLYVDVYKDGERVVEEWTSADMEEIKYQEEDPIRR